MFAETQYQSALGQLIRPDVMGHALTNTHGWNPIEPKAQNQGMIGVIEVTIAGCTPGQARKSKSININTQQYTSIHNSTQQYTSDPYTPIHISTHEYTQVYSNAQ